MKPDVRFNGGRGAVLCEECQIIVDEGFTNIEWDALRELDTSCYCQECNKDKNWKFEQAYAHKIKELLDSKDKPLN